jgi:hypothetical protein
LTVPAGTTGAAKTLPLTEVTVAGKCEFVTAPPAPSEEGLARIELSVSSGTMDAIASSGTGGHVATFGGTTLTTGPAAVAGGGASSAIANGVGSAIVTANDATATITFGAHVDATTKSCTYV